MTYPDIPYTVEALTAVIIYAGPQSVTPEQSIHVTVEVTKSDEYNSDNHLIELSYLSDGKAQSMTAKTNKGLISFDVPAQKTTGLMMFSGKAGTIKSTNAVVIVKAGQPETLQLYVRPTNVSGTVGVSLGIITDAFGNLVSDLSLVTIEWLDDLGVKVSEQVQLFKGQAAYTAPCPIGYIGSLKLRASFKNVENISPDVSSLCAVSEE